MAPIRVVQLSDLHFSTKPGGYMLRDTAETFAAVAEQVRGDAPDLVVVTGDIANEGKLDEYGLAGDALASLDLPVHCLPGNHDFVDPLHGVLPRLNIAVPRSLRIGPWLFLFGDSNLDGGHHDPIAGWTDHPDRVDLARGGITTQELSWLRRQLELGEADHAMLWLHHPPGGTGMFERPGYDDQIAELVGAATPLHAIAAGHEHTGVDRVSAGVPSHVCPSTGVCVDFDALLLMPPGYRRFTFHDDGRIDTEVVWLEDERWADRWKLPAWVAEYFAGQMTDDEMKARMAEAPGQSG
ncbi:MAG: metallophosphoesterase [Acidimicrobiales bacterium]|nr:metallophosphoesterase [Acidimicrobiales bacterium]